MMHGSTAIVFNTSNIMDTLISDAVSETSEEKMNAIWYDFRVHHILRQSERKRFGSKA